MKVVYNLDLIRYPLTGIGYYTKNAILSIQKNFPQTEIIGCNGGKYCSQDEVFELINQAERRPEQPSNTLIKRLSQNGLVNKIFQPRKLRKFYTNYQYRQSFAKIAKPDIYHETTFSLLPIDAPKITTIHDISVLCCPEFHPKARVDFFKKEMKNSINAVESIVVNCQFIKNQVLETFDVSSEKVQVATPGVNENFKPRDVKETLVTLNQFDLHYDKFILYVGTLEPRKNVVRLIKAYKQLAPELKKEYPLVLVGGKGWLYNDIVKEISDSKQDENIIITDYVSTTALYHLYSAARVFAYPSLHEGFGLPVLEAMASGTPVVTSNVSSLPEVCGDAGLQVNPLSVLDIAEAMEDLLSDKKQHDDYRERALVRAKQFSWDNFGKQLMQVYKQLI